MLMVLCLRFHRRQHLRLLTLRRPYSHMQTADEWDVHAADEADFT